MHIAAVPAPEATPSGPGRHRAAPEPELGRPPGRHRAGSISTSRAHAGRVRAARSATEHPVLLAMTAGLVIASIGVVTTASSGSEPSTVRAAPAAVAAGPRTAPDSSNSDESRVSRSRRAALVPADPRATASTGGGLAAAALRTATLPVTGSMSSCYCTRWGSFHTGVDIAAPLGTPIVAAAAGRVVEAGPAQGFGNWVVVQHPDGTYSVYGHMRTYEVETGQDVVAGQLIAQVGNEGISTGPHLHFEVRAGSSNGTSEDPLAWLRDHGVDPIGWKPTS